MTDGIVNVLKPPGMTSHDVVSRIRRIYGVKKAGHSGTLDPDAAGVLPVFIGNATRLLEYASTNTKHYRAEGILGIRTDTGDDSGNVLETKRHRRRQRKRVGNKTRSGFFRSKVGRNFTTVQGEHFTSSSHVFRIKS